jgi:hypothetical protein
MRTTHLFNFKASSLTVTAILITELVFTFSPMKFVTTPHQALAIHFKASPTSNKIISIEPAQVSIAPEKSRYDQKEVVTAIIINNLETPIVSLDMKSYCSMVYLQKLEKDQWINTASCTLRRAPFPTTIRFGEKIKVALVTSTNTPGPNATGIYRLNFPFRIGTLEGKESVVTSQTFRIDSADGREKVSFLPK